MRISAIILLLLFTTVMFALTGPIQIGNHDGNVNLIYPNQVIEGPDANIYVFDEKDSYIKVFSSKGILIRTISGPGEGPGYIKRSEMVHFGFTPNKLLYITEYFGGHRWITLLKQDGSLQKVINPGLTSNMYGVEKIFSLKDHTYLIEFSFLGLAEKKGNFFLHSSPQTIYHMDTQGNLISTIKKSNFFKRISYFKRGADLGLPFAPSSLWTPFEENSILFTDGMDNSLWVINLNGKIIRKINTELPEVPLVTNKDIIHWRETIKNRYSQTSSGKEWYERFGKVIEEYKKSIYERKAYIKSLQVTAEGNILIASIQETETTSRNFWLLNSKGKILAHSEHDIFELQISPHYILVKKYDADENIFLYCYKREKDEIRDFYELTQRSKK